MANPYSEGKLMIGNINVIRENLSDIIMKLIVLLGYENIDPKEIPCNLSKKLSEIVCNIDDIDKLEIGQLKPLLELLINKSKETLEYLNTIGIDEARLNAGLELPMKQKGGKRKDNKIIEKFLKSVIKFDRKLQKKFHSP
jgi:hypothetical protein